MLDPRVVELPAWNLVVAKWRERDAVGNETRFYSVSQDGGITNHVRRAKFTIGLDGVARDPLETPAAFPADLLAGADTTIHVVQFITHSLPLYRRALRDLGATLHGYVAHCAYIVEMDAGTRAAVEALPFVRWMGPYHPFYKFSPELRDENALGAMPALESYTVSTIVRGQDPVHAVADRIAAIEGEVHGVAGIGGSVMATLSPDQLLTIARWDEVSSVSRQGQAGLTMDIARAVSGGQFVTDTSGFMGIGARGEIVDGNDPDTLHEGFQSRPPLPHIPDALQNRSSHATRTYGTLFGEGTDPAQPDSKGLILEGQGFYSDYHAIVSAGTTGTIERMCHTCQLVSDHPTNCWQRDGCGTITPFPYDAVFQTNSWKPSTGTFYTGDSMRMDEAIFTFDLSIMTAQGNEGTQISSAYAWAKSLVSVGGVVHMNTPEKTDDSWGGGPSIGPAGDGRIKPDLIHFYDGVHTTDWLSSHPNSHVVYERLAGGTSIATPITAGHFGLFYQMWHEGRFNVCNGASCARSGGGASVFDSRAHAATAKAMMINTASLYEFTGSPPPNPDLTREKQGWGMPDVKRLYLLSESFPILIDETVALELYGSATYQVTVPDKTFALRATLAYRDPPATGGCDLGGGFCRINDLTLKVSEPAGPLDCYLGNHGLMEGNWSTKLAGLPDCDMWTSPYSNTVDTVENVFVSNPTPGTWGVRVAAVEVNEDANVKYINDDPSECIPDPPPGCFDPADTTDDVPFALVVSLEMDCDRDGISDVEQEYPIGACCVGGVCSVISQSCCTDQGGLFGGDKTTCDDCDGDRAPDVCDVSKPVGACCLFPGDSCQELPECSCTAWGGTYVGDDTSCAPVTCDAL